MLTSKDNLRVVARRRNHRGGLRCCTRNKDKLKGNIHFSTLRLCFSALSYTMSLSNHFLMLLVERSGFSQAFWQPEQTAITRALGMRTLRGFFSHTATRFFCSSLCLLFSQDILFSMNLFNSWPWPTPRPPPPFSSSCSLIFVWSKERF